jgi:Arc/MetJ family transcription regulator
MPRSSSLKRKNVLIDQEKLARTQSLLNARTETEAIDRALDEVLFGQEVMAALLEAAGRGKTVEDVFRNLR